MKPKLLAAVLMVALLVAGVVAVALDTGSDDPFCDDFTALLVDTPPGWDVLQDHGNDCQFTLFNEAGQRGPAELYAELSIEPPTPLPLDLSSVGIALIVGALVGLVAVWLLPGWSVHADPPN